jgi:hypothetical protein
MFTKPYLPTHIDVGTNAKRWRQQGRKPKILKRVGLIITKKRRMYEF